MEKQLSVQEIVMHKLAKIESYITGFNYLERKFHGSDLADFEKKVLLKKILNELPENVGRLTISEELEVEREGISEKRDDEYDTWDKEILNQYILELNNLTLNL